MYLIRHTRSLLSSDNCNEGSTTFDIDWQHKDYCSVFQKCLMSDWGIRSETQLASWAAALHRWFQRIFPVKWTRQTHNKMPRQEMRHCSPASWGLCFSQPRLIRFLSQNLLFAVNGKVQCLGRAFCVTHCSATGVRHQVASMQLHALALAFAFSQSSASFLCSWDTLHGCGITFQKCLLLSLAVLSSTLLKDESEFDPNGFNSNSSKKDRNGKCLCPWFTLVPSTNKKGGSFSKTVCASGCGRYGSTDL